MPTSPNVVVDAVEAKLREQEDMTYSIVRATAFFKSVSGQGRVDPNPNPSPNSNSNTNTNLTR